MTAIVDMIAIAGGSTGNLEIDGFSFNFGATSTLPGRGDGVSTPAQGALEQGVSEGLSIRVVPISETLEIVWNGEVLASACSNQLVNHGVSTMTVSVGEAGLVTVHLADVDLAAQIPSVGEQSGLEAADQTDWGFSFAGRTGGNTGEVWIDDISLTAQVVCFASGTLIETAESPVPVEDLARGDLVLTRDHGARPIRWIASRRLTAGELAQRPELAPIRIAVGALGVGLPAAELLVSPQHRLLARSPIARRMFGAAEVLVAAKHLTDLPGVGIMHPPGGVTYHHLLLDAHEIVLANGLEAESLFIGPRARRALGFQSAKEILALCPGLSMPGSAAAPARPLIGGRRARQMVLRHVRNKLSLTAPASGGRALWTIAAQGVRHLQQRDQPAIALHEIGQRDHVHLVIERLQRAGDEAAQTADR
ncbi:hypothetical protein GCM10011341_32970 [Frigidibacter albus]|nr:hypothetical protein GCM10011341_32970 [Frigidibacter albus]